MDLLKPCLVVILGMERGVREETGMSEMRRNTGQDVMDDTGIKGKKEKRNKF